MGKLLRNFVEGQVDCKEDFFGDFKVHRELVSVVT